MKDLLLAFLLLWAFAFGAFYGSSMRRFGKGRVQLVRESADRMIAALEGEPYELATVACVDAAVRVIQRETACTTVAALRGLRDTVVAILEAEVLAGPKG